MGTEFLIFLLFSFLKKDKREVGNFKDKFEKKVLSSRFTQKKENPENSVMSERFRTDI